VNQIKKLLASGDPEIERKINEIWGAIRTERNEQREVVVKEMRSFLEQSPGDPHRGSLVFAKVCGQCHKIYGEGHEVGPDITGNGRGSFEQLLSNVFDPSLVIGEAYQARTVITFDGRVLSGLPAEDSEQRIVLNMQGGKTETIAREDVDQMKISKLSLMPEGLESQLKPHEIADLFAFLTLDGPPKDPKARYIPGTPTTIGNRR
jgi:putative heme-binding domain-containing protein